MDEEERILSSRRRTDEATLEATRRPRLVIEESPVGR